jgi:hypothetical protein
VHRWPRKTPCTLADFDPCAEFHPQFPDHIDLAFDDVSGQAVGRDPDGQHSAQDRQFLENRDRIALDRQEIGGRQSRRAGADDGDFLVFFGLDGGNVSLRALSIDICQKPMQVHDAERFVHDIAGAGSLAGVVADPAAHTGERMDFLEKLDGFPVFSGVDQGDKSLNADMGGAGGLAGGRPAFGDGVSAWDGLSILLVGRLAGGEVAVVGIRKADRTDLGAFTATRAFRQIDVPRLFPEFGRESARYPLEFQQFGLRQQLDV